MLDADRCGQKPEMSQCHFACAVWDQNRKGLKAAADSLREKTEKTPRSISPRCFCVRRHTMLRGCIHNIMLLERGAVMELKVFRDTLSAAGSYCTVTAELPIETEILISDYLPQVFKIVKCFAKLVVLQKQMQSGRLNLEGYIRCIVYYQGEDGAGLCQTEQKLPFSKALDLPALEFSSFSAMVGGETEYLNCRAVNQRRVEVRGAYEVSASIYTQLQQEVVTAVADCGAEQRQEAALGVRSIACMDKLISTDNEFVYEKPCTALLDASGAAALRELKVISGKVVARGEITAQLVYRTADDDRLQTQQVQVPFHQICDVDGIGEDCRCFCTVEPVGFAVAEEQGEQEKHQKLTVSAVLHLRAYRDYELQLVADVFSTKFETETEYTELAAEQLEKQLDEVVQVQAAGQLSEEHVELISCFASFGVPEVAAAGENAVLRARGVITAFCENSLHEMESCEKTVDLVLPLAEAEQADKLHAECWLSAEDLNCSVNGGVLEVTVSVHVEGVILRRHYFKTISGVALGEEHSPVDPEIALRIYYAQPGEEIFEIARRFHVSPREMLAVNALEQETLTAGCRLLVPGVG